MSNAKSTKLRWYQYRLRTLLLVVLLMSLPLSWLAVKMDRVKKRRKAVAEIVTLGGEVAWDYQDGYPSQSGAAKPPGPTWLRKVLGDDFFARVFGVYLGDGRITDAGLEHLKGLNSLKSLMLDGTQVTDAGLEHLKGLTSLELLYLRDTQVTDAGLEHLKGLTSLGVLYLRDTRGTPEGVKKLQEALPDCDIRYSHK